MFKVAEVLKHDAVEPTLQNDFSSPCYTTSVTWKVCVAVLEMLAVLQHGQQ